MSMSILVLILAIVVMTAIIVLYTTGYKFESVILAIIFVVYAIHIVMMLL